MSMKKNDVLPTTFYDRDCIAVAKGLLGQTLVHVIDGSRMSGRIVEVECYLGAEDAAAHSFKGKRTARNEPMYMKPATAYVYSIYGMYFCFNVSSKGDGCCVLIRALEPLEGVQQMALRREKPVTARSKALKTKRKLKTKDLCNGPSKLCTALAINKIDCNKIDMASSGIFFIERNSEMVESDIVECKRIGIDRCGVEWADKPLRFYVRNSAFVSVRNKLAETTLPGE